MKTEAMPAKTEFKFDCPKCGQHILVSTDWVGLGINCPSCQTKIGIPSPPSGAVSLKPATSPQPTKPTIRIELSPKSAPAHPDPYGQLVGLNAGTTVAPPSVTGNEPWPELVQCLEKGALAEPAVLATALFRELTNVRQRLDEVEKKLALDKRTQAQAGGPDVGAGALPQTGNIEVARLDSGVNGLRPVHEDS
jgi:DNA-directed RNA polymerase subunit RPC12/RpoP